MQEKRVVIAVGGTGGHVYPALALAEQLDCERMFVSGGLKDNLHFCQGDYSFRQVSCGTFSLRGIPKICLGVMQAWRVLREYRPDLVIGFGSYYSLPTLIAARMCRIPILLHEQNSVPGKVNRFFSGKAVLTGVHFPDAKKMLRGDVIEVGMPLRKGLRMEKSEARKYYGLKPDKMTLLVFGGSQGARAVNELIRDHIQELPELQILHFIGKHDPVKPYQDHYKKIGVNACVKAFENRMDIAWQAADVMVSRSGAGTVAEMIEYEVPGVLIPYPYAMDDHQSRNADFVVKQVGGAVKCLQQEFSTDKIKYVIDHLDEMKQRIGEYKERRNQNCMVGLVEKIIEPKCEQVSV